MDINEDFGQKSTKALCDEFGADKVIFVKADVASDQEFEGKSALLIIFVFNVFICIL